MQNDQELLLQALLSKLCVCVCYGNAISDFINSAVPVAVG